VRGGEIERGSEGLDNPDPTQASPDVLQPSVCKRSSQRYQQQGRVSQMSTDTGEYDARKTVLSSTQEQEKVFAKHKERVQMVVAEHERLHALFRTMYPNLYKPKEK
jgi:hypothetical protein